MKHHPDMQLISVFIFDRTTTLQWEAEGGQRLTNVVMTDSLTIQDWIDFADPEIHVVDYRAGEVHVWNGNDLVDLSVWEAALAEMEI